MESTLKPIHKIEKHENWCSLKKGSKKNQSQAGELVTPRLPIQPSTKFPKTPIDGIDTLKEGRRIALIEDIDLESLDRPSLRRLQGHRDRVQAGPRHFDRCRCHLVQTLRRLHGDTRLARPAYSSSVDREHEDLPENRQASFHHCSRRSRHQCQTLRRSVATN